jgi:signal transduction histidine kinase
VLRTNVKAQVRQAVQLVESIYRQEILRRGPAARAQIGELIREALRELRFFDGRGYIFIDTLAGECVLMPIHPELEGSSLLDNQDDTGHNIMRGLIEAVAGPERAGFSRYRWYTPDYPDQMREKIAYVELFEPLDWIIGSGDYLYQVENDLKQQVLSRLQALPLGDGGYIAVLDKSGQVLLASTHPSSAGKSLPQLDPERRKRLEWLLGQATPEGRFVEAEGEGPGAEGGSRCWRWCRRFPSGAGCWSPGSSGSRSTMCWRSSNKSWSSSCATIYSGWFWCCCWLWGSPPWWRGRFRVGCRH